MEVRLGGGQGLSRASYGKPKPRFTNFFCSFFFFFGFNGRTSERFDESHEAGVGHLLKKKKKKKRKKMEQVLVLTIVLSFLSFHWFWRARCRSFIAHARLTTDVAERHCLERSWNRTGCCLVISRYIFFSHFQPCLFGSLWFPRRQSQENWFLVSDPKKKGKT